MKNFLFLFFSFIFAFADSEFSCFKIESKEICIAEETSIINFKYFNLYLQYFSKKAKNVYLIVVNLNYKSFINFFRN